jgi:hypothetical protein
MTPQPLQHATPQPQTPEPPQPVQKGPIPADHQILQEVFDGLKNRCISASNHPVSCIENCFLRLKGNKFLNKSPRGFL